MAVPNSASTQRQAGPSDLVAALLIDADPAALLPVPFVWGLEVIINSTFYHSTSLRKSSGSYSGRSRDRDQARPSQSLLFL